MSVEPASSRVCPVAHDFDPFGEEFQAHPGMSMRSFREEQPVFYDPKLDCYVVTRYGDIRAVFNDTKTFSPRIATEPIAPLREPALAKLAEYEFTKVKTLGVEEEPVHMRLRRRLQEPFSAESVARWEPRMREVFDTYIDGFVKRGTADLVAGITHESPAVIALEFLGVPQEDIAQTKEFATGVLSFVFGYPTDEEQIRVCDFMGQHQQHSRRLVERIIENPIGDGFLVHAVREYLRDPTDLDVDYLTGLAMNGLAAAHETTSNSAANALLLLLGQPASWQALCEDPGRIPNAVEECLRLGPPVATWRRLCLADAVVGGVEIPAGARMLLVLASGNCDEATFEEPERFDIERPNARRQVTFGIGAHSCLGARLARSQMRLMLEQLTARLPHMRLVEGQRFERHGTAAVGGPLALHVEWDPTHNPRPEDRP